MTRLRYHDRRRIIELKDRCWKDDKLIPEKVRVFEKTIQFYKSLGCEVTVYEMIVDNYYEKIERNVNRDNGGR